MRRTLQAARAVFALCLLAAAPAAAQEKPEDERLSSLLEGRVTFTLPASWAVRQHVNLKTTGRAQLFVPYPAAEKTPHAVEAYLVAANVPDRVTVRHLSDGVYENLFEGLAVTADAFDGDDWRTMVWTTRDRGVPYVFLNRFGLTGRVSVELLVAFPLLEDGDPKWVEKTLTDFSAMCASLKIDGRNRFQTAVKPDQLPKPRKVNPKP